MIIKDSLKGKKISVIGAGVSGKALADLASRLGADVFISEAKKLDGAAKAEFSRSGIEWEEGGNSDRLLDADEIVVSSGISPKAPILVRAAERGVKLIGELDFVSPYLNGVVIGVTGSNGKTTTTSMTGYFLEKLGCSVVTAGNIGNPVAKAAESDHDFIVLELSSFQLHWAKNFRCDVAIVTNLAPDHINWHGSYENYVAAKANIIRCLKDGGAAICQKRDEKALRVAEKKCRVFPLSWGAPEGSERGICMDKSENAAFLNGSGSDARFKLFDFSSVKLLGAHNLENTAMSAAALALVNVGRVPSDVISSYVPPAHRCAFAGKSGGITFVDDSKGTNVAATITAMSSLPGTKVIILGGQGKGEDYAPLAQAVKKYARAAVLLGSEKTKIAKALEDSGYKTFHVVDDDMSEAVEKAFSLAKDGDTVLLSPAVTSWDMYPNYNERGDDFCRIVKNLIGRKH